MEASNLFSAGSRAALRYAASIAETFDAVWRGDVANDGFEGASTRRIAVSMFSSTCGFSARKPARKVRIDSRTVPVLNEQTHGVIGMPCSCAYPDVISSLTNTSGRISRKSPDRDVVTGGNAPNRPVNRVFRSNASARSSAVWPSATTFAPNSLAIS